MLSAKARDRELVVVEDMVFPEAKTKHAAGFFNNFAKSEEFARMKKGNGVLVASGEKNDVVRRAMRNLPYAGVDEARNLNAYEVMQYKFIMFPKSTLSALAQ